MSNATRAGSPAEGQGVRLPSLRERKKARTRAAVQETALRLFRERGYEATSVEVICAAAEIGRTTFFRYFPTKEDVVLGNEFDPRIFAAMRAAPAELSPAGALRHAMWAVLGDLSLPELAAMRAAVELIGRVPALRDAFLGNQAEVVRELEQVIAERSGRDAADSAVRTQAGVLLGALLAVYFHVEDVEATNLVAAIDRSLACVEAGLPS